MRDDTIQPIAVQGDTGAPSADAQALIAATLTLMTACALAQDAGERACAAREVADNLRTLEALGELGRDFRRICGRLQALWEAQGA